MPVLRLTDVDYYYERKGSGEALLLLHGFTGSSTNWSAVATKLSANYDTIAVDLLGHGRTSSPPDPERYAMAPAADDLRLLLDKLGISGAHLLGYSMGGRLALYLAATQPERWRSLILESASPGLAAPEAQVARRVQDEQLAAQIIADGIPAFVKKWETLPLFASQQQLSAEIRDGLSAGRLRNSAIGLANSLRAMGTGRQPPLWGSLSGLSLPALLLAGELDAKFVSLNQQMADQLPDARLRIIPGAGHTTHLEQPERFINGRD